MSYQLPETFYRADRRRSVNLKQLRIWSVLMILFALWNVFTPWGLIRRNRLAAEFPNSEFGIQRAYVREDRAIVIERIGYVDRMAEYVFGSDGSFSAAPEHDLYTGVQLDSAPRLGSKYMTSGYVIDIKPGELTRQKIRQSSRRIRRTEDPGKVTDTRVPLPRGDGKADIRSLKELRKDGVVIADVEVGFDTEHGPDVHSVLPGHNYLPFKDSHCYVDPRLSAHFNTGELGEPQLYITTDSERYIHRLALNPDQFSDNWVRWERTAYIDLPLDRRYDCFLGHDPDEAKLMLINSDGRISWFDDQSLALLDTYFLEGNWQREYASLFQSTTFYSPEFGIPLNRVQAFRIYRGLAVMLLAGLVLLIISYLPNKEEETGQPDDADSASRESTKDQAGY